MTFQSDGDPESSAFFATGLNTTARGRSTPRKGDTRGPLPMVSGRYQLIRPLGQGGFGMVYLANDSELGRKVALKVPRWDKELEADAVSRFLKEGQTLAKVSHPGVVGVFDVGVTPDSVPYVVMQYVEGEPLSAILKAGKLDLTRMMDYLLQIGDALVSAHASGLTHRDLKPSNILVGLDGVIRIVDFGLALHEDLTRAELESVHPAGTPVYMAPEQMRGENHLIDHRTDIWAFGVVLYQFLTGRVPFRSRNPRELFRYICRRNPHLPSLVNTSVPPELERICLRCLQKSMDDRYQSMEVVQAELRSFLKEHVIWDSSAPVSPTVHRARFEMLERSPSVPVDQSVSMLSQSLNSVQTDGWSDPRPGERTSLELVPKGLRAFDQNDAPFFHRLLPGPVDRKGVPESIRFWLSRLDPANSLERIPVGLIHGPSGCGKSSFVRAGLLPGLSRNVVVLFVDCTTDLLEYEILERLRREFPELPTEWDLGESLRRIRLGGFLPSGERLLIVLDQFEQWLARQNSYGDQDLTAALRQCDGDRLQSLLLVREDFWGSISRFFRDLQQRISDRSNAMALPLLDEPHARRVLEAYGRALGVLPAEPQPISRNERQFIKLAVQAVAEQGQVICVHLSVLAETCKHNRWEPAAWKMAGGWEGIGREYIAGIFNHPGTPGFIRRNSFEAWRILEALLPDAASGIRGLARSRSALEEAVGLQDDPERFEQLLEFLLHSARLISPLEQGTTAPGGAGAPPESEGGSLLFGLTHDFLVQPIRTWGQAKQNETPQGRSTMLLKSLAEQWKFTGDRRFLPGWPDYLRIFRYVDRALLRQYRDFWAVTNAVKRTQMAVAAGLFLTCVVVGWRIHSAIERQSLKDLAMRISMGQLDWTSGFWPAGRNRIVEVLKHLELNRNSTDPTIRFRTQLALLDQAPDDQALASGLVGLLPRIERSDFDRLYHTLFRRPGLTTHFRELAEQVDPAQRARLGWILAWQGDWELFQTNCQLAADPVCRTETILRLEECGSDLGSLLMQAEKADAELCGDSLSAILAGLSLVERENLDQASREKILAWSEKLFRTHPSAGVHAAAWYLFRSWGHTPPYADSAGIRDADWKYLPVPGTGEEGRKPLRILMVRIRKGELPPLVIDEDDDSEGVPNVTGLDRDALELARVVKRDFWISAFEIPGEVADCCPAIAKPDGFTLLPVKTGDRNRADDSRRLYPDSTDSAPDGKKARAAEVDYKGATDICLWFAESIGRGKKDGDAADANRQPMLELRLPTLGELELAQRAGSTTTYFTGEDRARSAPFTGFAGESPKGKRGLFLPNGWGLFDACCNSFEWLQTASDTVNFQMAAGGNYMVDSRLDNPDAYLSSGTAIMFLNGRSSLTFRIVVVEAGESP